MGSLQSVISDNWKLIFDLKTRNHKLFNLTEDPEEKQNLMDKEIAQFETMNAKRRNLEIQHTKLLKALNLKKEDVSLSRDQIDQLKKLGYIQ